MVHRLTNKTCKRKNKDKKDGKCKEESGWVTKYNTARQKLK